MHVFIFLTSFCMANHDALWEKYIVEIENTNFADYENFVSAEGFTSEAFRYGPIFTRFLIRGDRDKIVQKDFVKTIVDYESCHHRAFGELEPSRKNVGNGININLTTTDLLGECEWACFVTESCTGFSVSAIFEICEIFFEEDLQSTIYVGFEGKRIITGPYFEFSNPCSGSKGSDVNYDDDDDGDGSDRNNQTYGNHISVDEDEFFFGDLKIPEKIFTDLLIQENNEKDAAIIFFNGEKFDAVNDDLKYLCINGLKLEYIKDINGIYDCDWFFGIGENTTFTDGDEEKAYFFLSTVVDFFGEGILDCLDSKNFVYAWNGITGGYICENYHLNFTIELENPFLSELHVITPKNESAANLTSFINEFDTIFYKKDDNIFVNVGWLDFESGKERCDQNGMSLLSKISQLEDVIELVTSKNLDENRRIWLNLKNEILADPISGFNLNSKNIFVNYNQSFYYPEESDFSNSWCVGAYSDNQVDLGVADGLRYSRTEFLYKLDDALVLSASLGVDIVTELEVDLEDLKLFLEKNPDRVYKGQEFEGYKYFIFSKSIEGGNSIQTVSTSLRLTDFEGIENFCGDSFGCSPDPADEQRMKDEITNSTLEALPGRDITIDFKSWARGSVVCDYDIVETVPLALVTDTYVSPMDSFLASMSVFDKFGVDKNFTEGFTQASEVIECKTGYFACDFGNILKPGAQVKKKSACLPDVLKCDGILQCPTGFDEDGCAKIEFLTDSIPLKPEGEYVLYDGYIWLASTDFSNAHYPGSSFQSWNLKTTPGLAFLASFIHFNTEYDRHSGSCADKLEFKLLNGEALSFVYEFCGDMESASVPFVPPRSLPILSTEVEIEFESDAFTDYDGFLIPVEWACDGEIDCSSGADESGCSVGSHPKRHQHWSNDGLEKHSFLYGDFTPIDLIENDLEALAISERAEKLGLSNDTFSCGNYTMHGIFECDGFVDCLLAEDELACTDTFQEELVDLAESNSLQMLEGVSRLKVSSPLTSISSDGFPNENQKNFRSLLYLSGPVNSIFIIYPIHFYLPSVTGCLSNRLDIHDGGSLTENLIWSFCSLPSNIPAKITTKTNEIVLNLKIDYGDSGKFLFLIKNIEVSGAYNETEPSCESWPVQYLRAYPNLFINSDDSTCKPFAGDDYCFQNGTLESCSQGVSFDCPPTTHQCSSGTQCVPFSKVCDLIPDCPARDDEESCQFNSEAFEIPNLVDSDARLKAFTPNAQQNEFILLALFDLSASNSTGELNIDGQNMSLNKNLLFVNGNITSLDIASDGHEHIQLIKTYESYTVLDNVFTNSLTDQIMNYESGKTYLYSIQRTRSFTLSFNRYNIEAVKSFRGNSEFCVDQLLVFDDGILVETICGEGEDFEIDILSGQATILLISDRPGKYDLRNTDMDRFMSLVLKNELNCCAADCASRVTCSCPDDTGFFVASVSENQVKRRSLQSQFESVILNMDFVNCTLGVPSEGWTNWMSAVTPTGIQLAGVYVSGGEEESTSNLRNYYSFCPSSNIINVECRAKSGSPLHNSVQCSKSGVFCLNRNLAGNLCDDHEIRFFCVCDVQATFENTTSCSAGWDTPQTTSLDQLRTEDLESRLKFLRGINCINQAGTDLSDLDQTGFNPSFSCNLADGYRCAQKAPCHPCPPVQVKLWKSCSDDANFTYFDDLIISNETSVVTQETFLDPKQCYSFSGTDRLLGNVTKEICDGNCWAISYFDDKKGHVWDELGCQKSDCVQQYSQSDCFRATSAGNGQICVHCCTTDLCNYNIRIGFILIRKI
ncbi:Oidioi.mRNA.OKI2018_I69.chr2.g7771.t1.cds [Oikopleura dioica]|uniref:Oidioi.mRNA.OKI2018_I69.chr2.g7771.t1.cds n=1 Tax=Oikopleura dioica TaxID=34765 RepID=A0ABN7TFW5_OIKDI|nr:Oidioi.mRNA.OKI2018_I69.chr2.g7771.t1.cds [Oikopleura dioica]